jgi:type I restriction enzyme S subunit
MELNLPDPSTQQKYVDIYKAMVANQQCYERGLEDLRMICEGHFDDVKTKRVLALGDIIERVDSRNSDNFFGETDVKGITNNKEFSETRADITSIDLSKFKIVEQWHFAYNSRTDGRDMLVLALNKEEKPVIVTFNYNVFKICSAMSNVIDAEYLYAYFKRSEFDRRVRFSSWGSSQELLSWENLCDIKVPVPDIQVQKSIADIMNVYILRKEINEQLKAQIKDICPILIRGSLEEG